MTLPPSPPAQQILVATDFSDTAEDALAVAVRIARALRARLHVLHVFSAAESDVTRLLADAAATAGPDVPVTVAAAGGDPAQEILRYAARHAIDLIVVGTHGRSGLSRLLLGNVAERVLRSARRPVVVVPAVPTDAAPAASRTDTQGESEAEPRSPRRCLVCAAPTQDLICEPCRARIRGETLEHKYREERAGRT